MEKHILNDRVSVPVVTGVTIQVGLGTEVEEGGGGKESKLSNGSVKLSGAINREGALRLHSRFVGAGVG